MDKEEEIKLAKCPECKSAFYVKTQEKERLRSVCPICKKEVELELNGEHKNGNLGTNSESSTDQDF